MYDASHSCCWGRLGWLAGQQQAALLCLLGSQSLAAQSGQVGKEAVILF